MLRAQRLFSDVACFLLPLLLIESAGTDDVGVFLGWQGAVGDQGVLEAYRALTDQYPPLTYAALAVASAASRILHWSPFHAFKLLLLISGYVSTLVVRMWRPRLVLPATALWATYGMVYGYVDVLFAAPLLVSLWCLERERPVGAGVAYALACAVKWQPVIIGPFILAHFWIRRDWPRFLGFTASAAMVLACVVAAFGVPVVVSFARAVKDPFISGNALNVPWLVTAALEHLGVWGFGLNASGTVANKTVSLADAPLPALMVVLTLKAAFAAAYGYLLLCYAASGAGAFRDLLIYGLSGFLAYFVLNTGVHENHLFVPALLAVLLLDFKERPRGVMEGVLACAAANLVLFFGLSGERVSSGALILALDAITAALLTVLLAGLLMRAGRGGGQVAGGTAGDA